MSLGLTRRSSATTVGVKRYRISLRSIGFPNGIQRSARIGCIITTGLITCRGGCGRRTPTLKGIARTCGNGVRQCEVKAIILSLAGRCARTTICIVAYRVFVDIIEIFHPKFTIIAPVNSSVLGLLVSRPVIHVIIPIRLVQIVGMASRTGRTVFGCSYQRIVAKVA